MHGLPLAVGLSLIGSFLGLVLASSLLLFPPATRVKLVPWLVSYAVGTLLGSSLLHLVPESLEAIPAREAVFALLAGILSFFVLEKLVIWRHCHEGDDECTTHSRAASLVIAGDAFHTFIDGVIIGAAVLTSVPLGVSTAIAAATHEVPQELGDFGVLLHAGYTPRRALLLNVASGATGVVGAIAVYLAAARIPAAVPYLLAFAAGGFLYVAMADLIPGLHSDHHASHPIRQTVLIAAGIATMLLISLRLAVAAWPRRETPAVHARGHRRAARDASAQYTARFARHHLARALIKEGDRTEPAGNAQRRLH